MFNPVNAPSSIAIPDDIHIEYPSIDIQDRVRAFFGETGKWWGTWTSPQTKGGYDSILIIKKIKNQEEVDIAYLTSDFPKWYIKKASGKLQRNF